ncbi:aminotransferase class I/II-fold pyridoxal phosphate-dependent enzyme [Akkermansia muciniphila]|nr:aminotransferase class I/II-fold pyridoxal phosphate-dependent enzyme [Akkermansia muciniphila]
MRLLREMTSRAGVPLMIDNAYGPPLPNICFVPVTPAWDENMILTMSLSKIGLPGTRTGIVIARPEIIRAVVSMVTTSSLCPNNLGQALVTPYLEDGTLERVCRETLTPFYRGRAEFALSLLPELFGESIPGAFIRVRAPCSCGCGLRDCPSRARSFTNGASHGAVL